MPVLHISQRKQRFMPSLPYWVFINEQPLGIMRDKADIQMPDGNYKLGIWLRLMLWKWELKLGKEFSLTINGDDLTIEFWHSEPVWDFIFNLDLIIWVATLFFTIPHPWNIIYHILSDGFFIAWIIRQYVKRNDYIFFHILSIFLSFILLPIPEFC